MVEPAPLSTTTTSQSASLRESSNKKHFFASRPTSSPVASNFNQMVPLYANSYKLQLKTGKTSIQKYSVHFEPDLPDNSRISQKIIGKCRDQLKEQFKSYVFQGKNLYSTTIKEDDLVCTVEWDAQEYKVKFMHSKEIDQ